MGKWRKRTKRAGKQVRIRETLAYGQELLAQGESLIQHIDKKHKTTVGSGTVDTASDPEVKSLETLTDFDDDYTADVATSAPAVPASSTSSSAAGADPGGEWRDGLHACGEHACADWDGAEADFSAGGSA